jgi:hypothetical protein
VAETTCRRSDCAARWLTAAWLYLNSPPEAPTTRGRINPNINDDHSDPVDHVSRDAGSWSYIQGSTCSHENEGKTNNLGWMLCSVYAVFGVNSWSWHGVIEMDALPLCSAMMVQLWTRQREMGDENETNVEDMSRYEKIRGTTFLIGLGRPYIGVMIHWIRPCTCRIGDGILTRIWNCLKSQFRMKISPISLHLSRSHPQLHHHQRARSYIIPLNLSMPQSRGNTVNCIIRRSTVSHSQPVSSLGRPWCTQFSTFSQLWVDQWIESQLPSPLLPEPQPPHCLPPSISRILLGHGLQVHLQTRSITAWKCISQLTRSRPTFLSSLYLRLQVHLQTGSIPASKCISEFTWFQSPSTSPHTLECGLQLYLQWLMADVRKFRVNGGGQSDGINSVDPGVGRHNLISILSYHTMKIHTLSFSTFGLTLSVRDFVDACNCVDYQCQIGSYLFTQFLFSTNQHRSLSWISFICHEMCRRVLMVYSLTSRTIGLPEWPRCGPSLSPRVQVLLRLCWSTICFQIDCMYIYRDT